MKRILLPAFVFLALLIVSCKPDLSVPTPSAGTADFTRTVAVGDNFLSGYQDGALFRKGQTLSIPALMARQFPNSSAFAQPLMQDDYGVGYDLNPYSHGYVQKSTLGYRTDCAGATTLFPQSSTLSAGSAAGYLMPVSGAFNNLSVPYLRLKDYFNAVSGQTNGNVYYHRFASSAGTSTVYKDAVNANATFFTVWTGMEDIYAYARNGGVKRGSMPPIKDTLPSSAEFSIYLDSLLHGLTANGAKGLIATIPSPESFPFYTLVPYNGLALTQHQADSLNLLTSHFFNFQTGNNGFVIDCPTCGFPYRLMGNGEHIVLDVPLDSIKCVPYLGSFNSIPDAYILDSMEMNSIHQAIAEYNAVIVQKASQYNLALADMNGYFTSVTKGITWDGATFNADFISGGFFSLDGFHPNQKGYALIANEFIKAINTKYGSTIPPVNCLECDGILFP